MNDEQAKKLKAEANSDQLVEAAMDVYGLLDILCGDFPEGIQDYHRRVAERMGLKLPEEPKP